MKVNYITPLLILSSLLTMRTHGGTNSFLRLPDTGSAYITVADTTDLQLVGTDYSITGWVRLNQYDSFGSCIIAKRSSGSKRGFMLNVAGTTQGAEARTLSFIVSESSDPRIFSSTPFPTGAWHHVAVTYVNATGATRLYIDGCSDAMATLPTPLVSTSPLYIGRDSKQNQYQFRGDLDELQIWRRALSSSEVRSNMTHRAGTSETSLAAAWDFNLGNVDDASPNNRDGVMQGVAATVQESAPMIGMGWAVEIPFLSGSPINRYRLQYSLDSNSTNWLDLGETLPGTEGWQSFYDSAPDSGKRFYRVIQE